MLAAGRAILEHQFTTVFTTLIACFTGLHDSILAILQCRWDEFWDYVINNALCAILNTVLLYFCKYEEFDHDKIGVEIGKGIHKWVIMLYKLQVYPHVNRVHEKM